MTLLSADILYASSTTYAGDCAVVFDSRAPYIDSAVTRLGRLVDTIVDSCGINPLIATHTATEAKLATIKGLHAGFMYGQSWLESQNGVDNG